MLHPRWRSHNKPGHSWHSGPAIQRDACAGSFVFVEEWPDRTDEWLTNPGGRASTAPRHTADAPDASAAAHEGAPSAAASGAASAGACAVAGGGVARRLLATVRPPPAPAAKLPAVGPVGPLPRTGVMVAPIGEGPTSQAAPNERDRCESIGRTGSACGGITSVHFAETDTACPVLGLYVHCP